MAKFELWDKEKGTFAFFCPGCNYNHSINNILPNERGAVWQFNGDLEKPTVSPSILVNKDHPGSRCHSFVKEGKIQFLPDCHHDKKGTTVELPEIED